MDIKSKAPFLQLLGCDIKRWEGGESEVVLALQHQHLNSFSVAHGGVIMTLFDVAMALAVRSLEPESGGVTIELKTSFIRAGKGVLNAKGKVLHRTATLAFAEAQILDDSGKIVAHATGTFKYMKRLPVGNKEVKPFSGSTVTFSDD